MPIGIADAEDSLRELKELTVSAGAQVVGTALQRSSDPDPATLLGRGKVQAVRTEAHALGADLVIFDHDLTSTQLRNLEKIIDLKVIDRTQIILEGSAGRDFGFIHPELLHDNLFDFLVAGRH